MRNPILSKEDYEEPRCPLKRPESTVPIPVSRVVEKLDEYLGKRDYPAAERHLCYWLAEAESCNDGRGKLTVLNEQIGLYRKLEREPEGLASAETALALARKLELDGTITMGTTLVNAATAYKAFGQAKTALPLYRQAREIYEQLLEPGDARLGGLYNNMALALTEPGDYALAEELFEKALHIMSHTEHGEAEMAITYCNLADLAAAQLGMERAERRIGAYLDKAQALLDTVSLPRDGYYAFVCEKCATTFGYYGYFFLEAELLRRAEEIYERP